MRYFEKGFKIIVVLPFVLPITLGTSRSVEGVTEGGLKIGRFAQERITLISSAVDDRQERA